MRKDYIFHILTLFVFSLSFISCSEDDLSSTSVIKDSQREENDFDKWIYTNYIQPYNIDIKYRYEDIESDLNYQLTPADYEKSIQLAKLVKYLCLEVYDDVTGSKEFIRSYYPKMINLIGSAAYRNNGTMILGTAEGGLKITLYYVNALKIDPVFLNTYYFKTMHHEFTHILNQTKPYSTDFNMISGTEYVSDTWNTAYTTDAAALQAGFISPYASSEANEDFAELLSIYVTHSQADWNAMMTTAGTGATTIKEKFEIVYNYMLNSWNIDLNDLRDNIQERQANMSSLDLNSLN